MLIFGCFETRTQCDSCGQPVPINGPLPVIECSYCFNRVEIGASRYASLLTDLVDEYDELADRQGRGGQVISDRTYHYGYWRLAPRCRACKKQLAVGDIEPGTEAEIVCECGKRYESFPAPDWLMTELPSAVQCYCAEREAAEQTGEDGMKALSVDEAAPKPVVMACPQCGGALKISVHSDRIHECEYCQSNVYIPDPLWRRLHPVKQVAEWWVGFQREQPVATASPEDDVFDDFRDPAPSMVEARTYDAIDAVDDGDDRLFLYIGFGVVLAGLGVLVAMLFL